MLSNHRKVCVYKFVTRILQIKLATFIELVLFN